MIVELKDGFYLETDELNYILYRRYIGVGKVDKKEKEMIDRIGFYSSFESAMYRYIELHDIAGDERTTLEDYVNRVEKGRVELAKDFANEIRVKANGKSR